ncbi:nucleotidyl transferase AbiEii/AbiGii toxin family protein [Spirosoma pollinicola]|uniref:Nucleotidyl transferase AbiEii/AbiGii toxin family protein n=1 Tax=Spirosoma pollinicola TaxID=2057025 RepID=A0A2K8Z4Z4_9BACT|nr:nucleotidyl transferase AbiEii/AbiGii toxin family protein [Spirosoma pollinicola]AUD04931.1 hypothetical protein CWM47_25640 [Spirosoma pollinicola]
MNHHTNLVRIRAVAAALAELNEKVVFVGGATISLHADDSAAAEPRPTDDIDVVIEVATYREFSSQIEDRLRQLGFTNDYESGVICRYKIHGLLVDVMPTDSGVLGFTNRWYKDGVKEAIIYQIDERQSIRIFSAPYFIATKIEAFNSFRHGRDPRMNSDFEDIIYLFDNRQKLFNEIMESTEPMRSYVQAEINTLLSKSSLYEYIYAQLERSTASQRTERILKIWQNLINQ